MDIEGGSIFFDEEKPEESFSQSLEEALPNIMAMNLTNYNSSIPEPAVGRGHLDVQVRLDRSKSGFEMPTYPMTANPRGRALIVEFQRYMNNIEDPRIGSHHDVDNLKSLFTKLGFVVSVMTDLTKKEFEDNLREFAASDEHKAANMMILVILSHGQDGHIITTEGKKVLHENIFEQFNNHYCPNLKGKPKFFIIQACRGESTDKVLQTNQDDDEDTKSPAPRKRPHQTLNDSTPLASGEGFTRKGPTWEDFIIAYSTIPGYVSNRDPEKGTWFIQSLVEIFSYHAIDKELIDLLRMTSERLSQFENNVNEKQTCNIELRHLYKRIYFQPEALRETLPIVPSPALRRSKSNPPASPRRERPQSYLDDDFYE